MRKDTKPLTLLPNLIVSALEHTAVHVVSRTFHDFNQALALGEERWIALFLEAIFPYIALRYSELKIGDNTASDEATSGDASVERRPQRSSQS